MATVKPPSRKFKNVSMTLEFSKREARLILVFLENALNAADRAYALFPPLGPEEARVLNDVYREITGEDHPRYEEANKRWTMMKTDDQNKDGTS